MIEPNNIGMDHQIVGYGPSANAITGPILPSSYAVGQQTKINQSSSRPFSPLNGHHQFGVGAHFPESPSAAQNEQRMGFGGIGSASSANLSTTCPPPTQIQSPMDLFIDFTRPDASRTRPLLVDGKRLYVDEHYISVGEFGTHFWKVFPL